VVVQVAHVDLLSFFTRFGFEVVAHFEATPNKKLWAFERWYLVRKSIVVVPLQLSSSLSIEKQFEQEFGQSFFLTNISRLEKIGEGNFGTVFLGEWNREFVALKTLKIYDSFQAKLLVQEAKLIHALRHPAVVQIFGCAKLDDSFTLILEYCPKGSLLSWLRSTEGTEVATATLYKVALSAACAVLFMERKQMLHRDIAARNFLVMNDLRVKLSDFGMARMLSEYSPLAQNAFPLRWSSPEVILQSKWTLSSDRYAFGVCLYEIFTRGSQPWLEFSNQQIIALFQDHKLLPSLGKPSAASESIYTLIIKLTIHEPNERPLIEEVVHVLEQEGNHPSHSLQPLSDKSEETKQSHPYDNTPSMHTSLEDSHSYNNMTKDV